MKDASCTGFLTEITPIILTYNEASNIRRSLEKLIPFVEVLIVDSGSNDKTLSIVSEFPNARVISRPFDSFSGQWNYALREGGVTTEWVLAMDADYILTDGLLEELSRLSPELTVNAYVIGFDYCIFGKKLSATLYPPIIALYRHRQAHYKQDGHCMRAQVRGRVGQLHNRVQHDDRKPLSRWLASQAKYADQEAELLLSKPVRSLRVQDRLRKWIIVAPWLVPLYCLTVGRGALDGWAGIYYAMQRGLAETLLALRLIELRLTKREK